MYIRKRAWNALKLPAQSRFYDETARICRETRVKPTKRNTYSYSPKPHIRNRQFSGDVRKTGTRKNTDK